MQNRTRRKKATQEKERRSTTNIPSLPGSVTSQIMTSYKCSLSARNLNASAMTKLTFGWSKLLDKVGKNFLQVSTTSWEVTTRLNSWQQILKRVTQEKFHYHGVELCRDAGAFVGQGSEQESKGTC